jgi:hypothetical protein
MLVIDCHSWWCITTGGADSRRLTVTDVGQTITAGGLTIDAGGLTVTLVVHR